MRDVEGLQTEPAYPTVGFAVYKGRGNHIKLDGSKGAVDKDGNPDVSKRRPLTKLFEVAPQKGDGCYLELGHLESSDENGERLYYVVIPFTDQPHVEHKWAMTLYSDYEHTFVKIDPRLNCDQCGNPSGMFRVLDTLDRIQALTKRVVDKEKRLAIGDDGTNADFFSDAARSMTSDHSGPKTDHGYADLMPLQPQGQMMAGAGLLGGRKVDLTDPHGAVDVSEMVNFLKPLEDAREREGAAFQRQAMVMQEQQEERLNQIEKLKRELQDMGVSEEAIERATRKGSSICSVM